MSPRKPATDEGTESVKETQADAKAPARRSAKAGDAPAAKGTAAGKAAATKTAKSKA